MARVRFRYKAGKQGAKKEAPENGVWRLDYRDARGKRHVEKSTARTKAEAERMLRDVLAQVERQRRGLAPELPSLVLVREACADYRESVRHFDSYPDIDAQLRLYWEPALGEKYLGEVTPAAVDRYLNRWAKTLAPSTLKALRMRLGAVYRWCTKKAKTYAGPNPVEESTPVEVPERLPRVLTVEQLERLIRAGRSDSPIHFFAAMTGLRKGEVAGLRWEFVDLEGARVLVRYCYAKPRTKGKRDRSVPLHPVLVEVLRKLREGATSAWVFPNPSGGMRTENGWDAAQNFRVALVHAGLVKGWQYRCVNRGRRLACGFEEVRPVRAPARCPSCGMKLWATGIPLDFSFKDLRSTFATHLGNPRVAQLLLGHTKLEITTRHYYRTEEATLREAVEALPLGRDKSGTPALRLVAGQPDGHAKGE